jgi:hypothetical protein
MSSRLLAGPAPQEGCHAVVDQLADRGHLGICRRALPLVRDRDGGSLGGSLLR